MSVDAIGGVFGDTAAGTQRASVGQEDFLNIFLTQLSFQDPLEPLDNREFIVQLSQLTGVEQQRITNENIEGLLNVQAAIQSIGLIGNTVEVGANTAAPQVGEVTTITFSNNAPTLTIQTDDGTFLNDVSPADVRVVRE